MSGRTSRRSQAAGLAMPAVPIADVRTRKWTKQPRAVGHLTLWKWVPDQEAPTGALQKGAFKKTKGRKRQPFEVGRMTRSVRQHLDAPLELLNEYPVLRHSSRHSSTASSPAPHVAQKTLQAPPVPAVPTSSPSNPVQQPGTQVTATAATLSTVSEAVSAMANTSSVMPTSLPLPVDDASSMFSAMVSSDEQLEMALDDLPMLDADEDLFSAPFLSAAGPVVPSEPAIPSVPAKEPSSHDNSASNSASQSGQDEDNNTADDSDDSASDDDDGSANSASGSASPMPSPSPASSPMPSRSPSP